MMKGIILAGGSGTRLGVLTRRDSKQLLKVYDKQMIFYPLTVLMLGGIREILLISTPQHIDGYKELLGDGSQYGIQLSYVVQDQPRGLAEAFILGEEFLAGGPACLILGDNVFHGQGLSEIVKEGAQLTEGGIIYGYHVSDPRQYGVVEFEKKTGKVISIEEKPQVPKSNYAIPGLYFFDGQVPRIAKTVQPSDRGEVEITSIHNAYLEQGKLRVLKMGRGIAWLDTGNPESLLEAENYIRTIQKRQGLQVACPEEIALSEGWITPESVLEMAATMKNSDYGKYLMECANEMIDGI